MTSTPTPSVPASRSLRRRWPGLRVAAALLLALAGAAAVAASPRVVAIADVHGDLPAFEAVLRGAGVIDAAGRWVGGDTIVVQLGDLLDRGPAAKSLLDYVMALEQKAAKGGGRFVPLLGNHEVMNMVGDLRYVVPENYAEFVDAGSEKRRAQAWRQFRKWSKARAAARGEAEPDSGSKQKEAWLALHPPGLVEHREAFGPNGKYGRWLRSRSALLVLQATLFAHGGVSPAYAGSTVAAIDRRVHEEIARFDELQRGFAAEGLVLPFFDLPETTFALRAELAALDAADALAKAEAELAGRSYSTPETTTARRARFERFLGWSDWSIFAGEGPLWFRGYAQWSDAEGAVEIPKLRQALGVERFVVGHTPQQKGTIVGRFGGAVYLADTGMNSAYVKGGRGSALELAAGAVSALYSDGTRERLAPGTGSAAPAPPPSPRGVAPAVERGGAAPATAPATAPAPAPAPAAAAPAPGAQPGSDRSFLGPDGKPLPFATDGALLAFLRDAPVVEVKDIGEGITHPRRLTLEKDGVRGRAIFRNVSEEKRVANVGGGRREFNFRDSYTFEPAAYKLSLLFGLDRVPPADLRRYEGKKGSVQVWIEKAMTEGKRKEQGLTPPDTLRWKRQLQTMLVWDALIGNTDRNQGNILFGPSWEIWLIDHTRSFRQSTDLVNEDKIVWCERGFYEKLRSVSDDEIRAAARELLRSGETRGVIMRRKKLVTLLEGLVKTKGETSVLFEGPL